MLIHCCSLPAIRSITKPFAYLTIGIMLANMVGAPIAAGLLAMDGVGGLK